ncbi:hypothetical protein ACQ4PT_025830 [Festuca glaucescens]
MSPPLPSTDSTSPPPPPPQPLPSSSTRPRTSESAQDLSHLKSPANADAVRAFLADAGTAKADIASAIAYLPPLRPRALYLSQPTRISHLAFYLSLLGSYDKVEAAIKWNFSLLARNIDTVKLNIAFLQQCGLTCDDIADLYARGRTGNLLTNNLEHVKKMVACIERLGVSCCSGMFKTALVTVCNQRPARITAKLELLERALGYSEARMAVCKLPSILNLPELTLGNRVEFMRTEFGFEPSYIAHRPAILMYSL